MIVDLSVDDPRWTEGLGPSDPHLTAFTAWLDDAVGHVIALTEPKPDGPRSIAERNAGVAIVLTNDDAVRALNREWRGKDRPTNVLSFPAAPLPGLPEMLQPLGDMALAFDTCAGEAAEDGKSLRDHTTHLIIHGLLHLIGYDHAESAEADRMEALERRILARLGIADPYGDGVPKDDGER